MNHSVTDEFLQNALEDTLDYLHQGRIQMVLYPDFFERGYRFKQEKDIHHYLDNVARKNPDEMRRGFCHRILRDAVGLWGLKSVADVESRFTTEIENLKAGKPNSPELQKLKGEIREFEEELVWAYAGTALDHIHHLRLGFYSNGEGFPNRQRDVEPILNQLHRAQLFNYMRITNTKFGILINFGEKDRLHAEKYMYNDLFNNFELLRG